MLNDRKPNDSHPTPSAAEVPTMNLLCTLFRRMPNVMHEKRSAPTARPDHDCDPDRRGGQYPTPGRRRQRQARDRETGPPIFIRKSSGWNCPVGLSPFPMWIALSLSRHKWNRCRTVSGWDWGWDWWWGRAWLVRRARLVSFGEERRGGSCKNGAQADVVELACLMLQKCPEDRSLVCVSLGYFLAGRSAWQLIP